MSKKSTWVTVLSIVLGAPFTGAAVSGAWSHYSAQMQKDLALKKLELDHQRETKEQEFKIEMARLDRILASSKKPEEYKLTLRYYASAVSNERMREFASTEIERAKAPQIEVKKELERVRKSEQLAWETVAKVRSERPLGTIRPSYVGDSVGSSYLSAVSALSASDTVNFAALGSRTSIQWPTVSADTGLLFATSPVATAGLLSAKTPSSLITY